MNLRARRNNVLVEPEPGGDVSASGLHLIQQWHPPATAVIVSVGPLASKDYPDLIAGRRVAIKPMGGTELKYEGRTLRLYEAKDILGLLPSQHSTLTTQPD